MFIYGKDQQAFHLHRTSGEKWISRANIVLLVAQLICFVSSIIRLVIYFNHIMSNNFFITSQLYFKYNILDPNCSYHVKTSLGIFNNLEYDINIGNVEYIIDRNALDTRYIFAVTGLCFFLSLVNFIWYEVNSHELRYHFVVFYKDMITSWEVVMLLIGVTMTFTVNSQNQLLNDYIWHCLKVDTPSKAIYLPLLMPFELFIFYFLSLGILGINGFIALVNLLRKNPRKTFLNKEAEQLEMWRRNVQAQGQKPDETTQMHTFPSHGSGNRSTRDHASAAKSSTPLHQPALHSFPHQPLNALPEYSRTGEDKDTNLSVTHGGLLYSTNVNMSGFSEKHNEQGKKVKPPVKNSHVTTADGSHLDLYESEHQQEPSAYNASVKDNPPSAHRSREGGEPEKAGISNVPSKVLSLYDEQTDITVEEDKSPNNSFKRQFVPISHRVQASHDQNTVEGEKNRTHDPPLAVPPSPLPHPVPEGRKTHSDNGNVGRNTHGHTSTHHD